MNRIKIHRTVFTWIFLVWILTGGIHLLGQDKIYYSDDGNNKIQRANPNGTGIEDIITGINEPTGIAIDNTNGKIYYCDDTNNKIVKANLDGSSPTDVVTGLTSPNHIALDIANGYIYWSDNGSSTIKRADLSGLNLNVTNIVTGQSVAQIALDTANNHIYFADQGTKIRRADLNGTNINVTDIITGLTNAYGLALDLDGGMIYFSDFGTLKIRKRSIAGGGITDVASSLPDVDHITLDTTNQVIYFSTYSNQKIRKVNFNGTGLADVIGSGLGNTTGVAFYTPPIVAPTVDTPTSSSITSTTATLGGNVANTGGENVTERGIYWSTANGFTPPGQGTKVSESGSWGTGTFTVNASGFTPNTTVYFKAFATNSAGTGFSTQASFATSAIPPVVSTGAASGVGATGATLNGSVNANNSSTTATFEYGLTTGYGTTVTADQSPVTGMVGTSVSKTISGLIPNTTYHFRAVGQNSAGTTNGSDQTFTTSEAAPTVTTGAASGVSSSGATLNGTVNANNSSTTATFEYGLTISYGTSVTADQSPVTGTSGTAVSKAISGLAPNTTYHYRAVGQNGGGTTNGSDQTFTTSAEAPTVTTNAASGVSSGGATLNGTVNANNASTTATFEYGLTTGYGTSVTADQSPVTGASGTAVSKAISGLAPNTTYHYRAVGQNSGGTTNGSDQTFTTSEAAPTVTTGAASGVSSGGATLNGTVNANNSSTTATFEYGLTISYGTSVTADQSPVTGTSGTAVSKAISGLAPNTTYHYRAVGQNGGGTTNGSDQTFTTSAAAPTVTTNAASGVSTNGATLNGTVNANNSSTTVTFEYGLNTSYGTSVTADQSPVTGATGTAVSKAISGLAPNTTYHYRAVGQNGGGTTNGSDQTFTTSETAPTVTTDAASGVSASGATLNGTVNANNSSTTVTFEYGLTISYGTSVTADQSPVTGTTNTAVSKAITGLAPNTTYHYRAVGQNGGGTTNGSDQTFTTSETAPTVTTNAASGVSASGATLNGTINANNSSTTATFEYGLTISYGTSVTADQSPVTGTTNTAVSKAITGLAPNTTYHYRAVGQNGGGTANGADMTFTTSEAVPTVTTDAATGVSATGATLNGTVNANNGSTTVTFEYGLTTGYGTTVTADQSPVTGTTDTAVSHAVSGLTPNTTYHYRAVGQNGGGTANGADMTFTTSEAAPTVTTDAASGVSTTGATLNGTVNANNSSTTATFEYGLNTSYGTTVTADQSPVTGTTDTAVSKAITGLTENTTYHYRAVGQNAAGTTYSADMTFTTTVQLATVTTAEVTEITFSSAVSGGTVTSDGGSAVTARGVCWSTSSNPTIAGNKTVNGAGTGAFTGSITGLTENTTYYVRAYATNAAGTAYGGNRSFTTNTQALTVTITEPQEDAQVSGTVVIKADAAAAVANTAEAAVQEVTKVTFFIDGNKIAEDSSAPFETSWDSTDVADGTHSIKAIAYDSGNKTSQDEITVQVINNSTEPPEIMINHDRFNFGSTAGTGTAASHAASSGITTGAQTLLIYNTGGGTLNWTISPDAEWISCSPTAGTNAGAVSVTVNPDGLPVGTYSGTITLQAPGVDNSPLIIPVNLAVYAPGTTVSPSGYFETPQEGSTVMSSVPVTGWALDDIEVTGVKIYRAPVQGEGGNKVFIGDASLIEGARPDVEQSFPNYPKNYQAGWGYMMLTNFLPNQGNGTFTLYAVAMDKEGHETTLGSKTIVVDNAHAVKPFGSIDTPAQGGSAAGSAYVNFGWALTPQPNAIPGNGSTITVWVDGVPLGNPAYGQYRQDVAGLFPGYQNSNAAGGYFYLDTTPYPNGVHTISWSVKDNGGNQDGIGSRFFSVLNVGSTGMAETAISTRNTQPVGIAKSQQAPVSFSPVAVRKGYEIHSRGETLYPDNEGIITINLKEDERLEVWLKKGTGLSSSDVSGYAVIGNRLRQLPVGTTLDATGGMFYWQPAAGFFGEYPFVFSEKSADGQVTKHILHVVINPKY